MTLTPTHTPDSAPAQTVQQQHLKAAEHHDLASQSHKEAAKLHESGDHKAAEHQATMAKDHAIKAGVPVTEPGSKSAPVSSPQK